MVTEHGGRRVWFRSARSRASAEECLSPFVAFEAQHHLFGFCTYVWGFLGSVVDEPETQHPAHYILTAQQKPTWSGRKTQMCWMPKSRLPWPSFACLWVGVLTNAVGGFHAAVFGARDCAPADGRRGPEKATHVQLQVAFQAQCFIFFYSQSLRWQSGVVFESEAPCLERRVFPPVRDLRREGIIPTHDTTTVFIDKRRSCCKNVPVVKLSTIFVNKKSRMFLLDFTVF